MLSISKLFILCFFGIILLVAVTPANAAVRRYRFEVSKEQELIFPRFDFCYVYSEANKLKILLQLTNSTHTRHCTTKTLLTINGQFPGPTIYARRGDLVIVDVINRADHNITIHW